MNWGKFISACKYRINKNCLEIDNTTTILEGREIKEKGDCNKYNCPYWNNEVKS